MDAHGGSPGGGFLDGEFAVMSIHDALGNGQPQARAIFLAGKEGFKDMGHQIVFDTRAGVPHPDDSQGLFRGLGLHGTFQVDVSTLGHGFGGVEN